MTNLLLKPEIKMAHFKKSILESVAQLWGVTQHHPMHFEALSEC